jgi:hypothetical protein
MPLQTKASIASDLQHLGVRGGQLLMVHSSLSSIGYVLGGAQAVVRALIDVLGPDGTLTMPAFSPEVSDPAAWGGRPFGDDELTQINGNREQLEGKIQARYGYAKDKAKTEVDNWLNRP